MTAPITVDPLVRTLLNEAAEWRLLGLLFECPSAEWQRRIAAIATEIGDAELRAAAHHASEDADEGMYHSIFGPGGPAPPRQATYHESMELGYLMSALTGYYAAFAYTPTVREPVDHVAVEAGFVAYLKLKEAFALNAFDPDNAALAHDAAAQFVGDHLASMGEPLGNILSHSGVEYLVLAGKALAQRTGPKRQPLKTHASDFPILETESTFDCGSM